VNAPQFHGLRRRISASALSDALANDLSEIRRIDKMTWVEVGEVLGRGDDQAAKYADGSATMDWISYKRGEIAWGSRFTGSVDRLLERTKSHQSECEAQHCILKCALAIEESRDQHGRLTIEDIRSNRATLENARDAIDAQLKRLKPQSVA
jgi:hypothetical protein